MLTRLIYFLLQRTILLFGRTVDPAREKWIDGPRGFDDRIGADFHERYAQRNRLQVLPQDPQHGLMSSFALMNGERFDDRQVHRAVHDFYKHTASYAFDLEANWNPLAKPFAWLLFGTVSRKFGQLNFPLRAEEAAQGMSSELFPVLDADNTRLFTCWLRRLPASGRVIYAGFYSATQVPGYAGGVVRTVFPLPQGNVTVILYPEAMPGGYFRFVSRGKKFGGPGYYRVHEMKNGKLKVLMLPLRETLHLKPVNDETIDADHRFTWWNIPIVTLRFRITKNAEMNFEQTNTEHRMSK